MPEIPSLPPTAPPLQRDSDHATAAKRQAAQALEAHFLSEMLRDSGFGKSNGGFGGGEGEDQFASFLRQAHAEQMAKAGGIGLAEVFFQAMAKEGGVE